MPAAATSRTSTQRSVSTVNNSTTSKSSTSVSVSSTNVRTSDDLGHGQCVRVLFVGERTGLVAVQVECTEPHLSHVEGEPEDRADARGHYGRGERQPAGGFGIREIGLEHGPIVMVRIDAR